jgi:hypothetical protein
VVGINRRLDILFLVQCQIEPHNLNISAQFAVMYLHIYLFIYMEDNINVVLETDMGIIFCSATF